MATKQEILKNVSATDLEAALALLAESQRKADAGARKTALAEAITPHVAEALDIQPVKPSSKADSPWVGSVVGGLKVEVDGQTYTVQMTIKDDGASAVRKALIG